MDGDMTDNKTRELLVQAVVMFAIGYLLAKLG